MTIFTLTLDLTGHEHPANPAAQHAKVRELLGLAVQAIGSGPGRKGDLTVPVWNASEGVSRHVTIGSWEFTETAPAAQMEA